MKALMLQLAEVGALALIGISTHVLVSRARTPFLEGLEELSGRVVRSFARIWAITAGLLYLGFAVAVVPVDPRPVGAPDVDAVLDAIGLFTVLVAGVQLIGLATLDRIAHHLEPWPPGLDEA